MYLSKDQFLQRAKRQEKDHTLPDGTVVRLRELTLRARLDAQEAGKPDPETSIFADQESWAIAVARRAVLDGPDGQLLFGDADEQALRDLGSDGRVALVQMAVAAWVWSEADPDSFRESSAAPTEAGDADGDAGDEHAERDSGS